MTDNSDSNTQLLYEKWNLFFEARRVKNILTTFQAFTNSYCLTILTASSHFSSLAYNISTTQSFFVIEKQAYSHWALLSYRLISQSSLTNTPFNPSPLLAFVQYFMINDVRLHNTFQ